MTTKMTHKALLTKQANGDLTVYKISDNSDGTFDADVTVYSGMKETRKIVTVTKVLTDAQIDEMGL